jgi:hypothetical protein
VDRAVRKQLIELKVYAEINFDFVGDTYTIAREKAPTAPFSAVRVKCSIIFHDLESFETSTASGLGTSADTGDKAGYKAQTGALKYALKNAFLIPDEADPEADETVDENERPHRPAPQEAMPDFQDAQRGEAAPRPTPKPKAAAERPTQAPEVSKPVMTQTTSSTSAAFATVSAPTAAEIPTTLAAPAAAPASMREPGDEDSADEVLPTEAEMVEIRKKWKAFGDDMTDPNKGNLKSSGKLPVNRKTLVFLLQTTKALDSGKITKAGWDSFFRRVDAAVQLENGWVGLAKLINKANGIETKVNS